MEPARNRAVRGKAEIAPQLFSIRPAEDAIRGRANRGIRVFHVLPAVGEGEAGLAQIATQQCGVVHRRQLTALGWGHSAIGRRVSDGRLHVVFPGVFAVAYPRSDQRARLIAALLYAGEDAVISHRSAAALWSLLAEDSAIVDVTRQGRYVRPRPELSVRRVGVLDLRDVRLHQGLPVTAPARTLLDQAADADDEETERSLGEARARRLVGDGDLVGALSRAPNRPGARRLARVMRGVAGQGITRSKAERLVLRLIADAQLPAPQTNMRLCGFEVDFHWPAEKLVVEFDGYEFHRHRHQFENDRRRDQVLIAAGFRILRLTWRQLCNEPTAVVVRIGQALAAAQHGIGGAG